MDNDGGPAFPSEQGHIPDGTWNQTYDPGMSLLDHFAGRALAGMITSPSFLTADKAWRATHDGRCLAPDSMAEAAYVMAQAMLTERARLIAAEEPKP